MRASCSALVEATTHLGYGDFTVGEALEHMSIYRAFQAWSIAKFIGLDYSLPPGLVEGLWERVMPKRGDLAFHGRVRARDRGACGR